MLNRAAREALDAMQAGADHQQRLGIARPNVRHVDTQLLAMWPTRRDRIRREPRTALFGGAQEALAGYAVVGRKRVSGISVHRRAALMMQSVPRGNTTMPARLRCCSCAPSNWTG